MDGAAAQVHGLRPPALQPPEMRVTHAGVLTHPHRPSIVDALRPAKAGTRREDGTQMGNTLDEGMLIRRIIIHRTTKLLNGEGSHLTILIEHMDDTDYEVSVNDRKETPEYLTTLLAAVTRGADMMIRALDILRAIGYVDMRPIALSGRHIVFGLDRIALELEILENSNGEIECDISVTGEDQENVEAIERVLEKKGIDFI